MTAADYLAHQTKRQLERLIEAIRALPEDKIDWRPTPAARSALDQLRELATIGDAFPSSDPQRIGFTPERFESWVADMASRTDVDALIASLEEYTGRQIEQVRAVPVDLYFEPVENPWGTDLKVIDALSYHNWNMAYHEGQIRYIGSLLQAATP